MNDREYAAQRRRVLKLNKLWREVLSLDNWYVNFEYHRGAIPDHEGALATAQCDWEYLICTLRWDLTQVAEVDDEELEQAFIHEAMHVVVAELHESDGCDKHEERVVTILARIVQAARTGGRVGKL